GGRRSDVTLQARNLVYSESTLSDLDFRLAGSAGDHTIRVDAKATGLTLDSELNGAFAHGRWTGRVDQLNVNGSEALKLALQEPVEARLSRGEMSVAWFCLNGEPAKVCPG